MGVGHRRAQHVARRIATHAGAIKTHYEGADKKQIMAVLKDLGVAIKWKRQRRCRFALAEVGILLVLGPHSFFFHINVILLLYIEYCFDIPTLKFLIVSHLKAQPNIVFHAGSR